MLRARHPLDDWPRPLLLGHRGCRQQLPENTLEALALAADQGVHGFEIDVRLSASGSPVVFHDPTLARMTGGHDTRAVAALGDAELARVDLGGDARIPRLEQVLAYCRARGLLLDVEVKHDVPARPPLVAAVARLLADFCDGSVLLTSFDPRIVHAFRARLPRLPRALIIGQRSLRLQLHRLMPVLGSAAVCVDHTYLDAGSMPRWRAAPRVFAWTVNDATRARALLDLGVDGLISDHPGVVRETLSQQRAAGS